MSNLSKTGNSQILAWRLDGSKAETKAAADDNDFYFAANHSSGSMTIQLPPNEKGKKWYRVLDTGNWAESFTSIKNNIETEESVDAITDGSWTDLRAESFAGGAKYTYDLGSRSIVMFVQK
jgi:hypothetical protein